MMDVNVCVNVIKEALSDGANLRLFIERDEDGICRARFYCDGINTIRLNSCIATITNREMTDDHDTIQYTSWEDADSLGVAFAKSLSMKLYNNMLDLKCTIVRELNF